MIVAILLSYLNRIGQRRHFRDVFLGVAAAFVLILGGGVAVYFLIAHYDGSNVQTYFETVTYLVAAVALTYMTFWMQRHARTMSSDLEHRSEVALNGKARFGLGVLAFQAVGREGLETMIFTLAIIFASTKQAGTPVHGNLLLLGAVLGLLVALALAFAIYRLGARINLRIFFLVLGILLMIFAAGLLADAVENLQQLGWLPFGQQVLWNTSHVISENSSIGDALHTLLGYADQPTVLQAIVWVGYLAVSTTAFVKMSRRGARRRHAHLAGGEGHHHGHRGRHRSGREVAGAPMEKAPTPIPEP
jgi:high-affinity iron transporter